ncbi:phage terminase large subunit family protein [Candidatus Pacearchaeota archaeon]|nr:phage terminase large subunit family protein [Candidatus Pacearchaeota archaeon]
MIQISENDYDWLISKIDSITDEKITYRVSEWAAKRRYLPKELTPHPGFWDNDYTPFWVEVMDCMSADSPISQVAVMKPVQIGATTALIENPLGYTIEHDQCGFMYVSADMGLTKQSIEVKVDRMLSTCGLLDRIRPLDERSRKTGNTSTKKDFPGGFLLAAGAQNPGKLRSMSVRKLCLDELDGMPDKLGSEGSPEKLAVNRTKAFDNTRKILYISTPLVLQTSKIYKQYKKGDQRKFFVPCIHCGEMQELRWTGTDKDGEKYGIDFKVDEAGNLIEDSVCYICRYCKETWKNHNKSWFLIKGEWRATAIAKESNFRSYHINSLYNPPGMSSWITCVYDWLDCWDVKSDRVKDFENYKTFYNTVLGWPFEEQGEAPKFETIVRHRRPIYMRNEIPNLYAKKETGSFVLLLTAGVDIHKNNITIEICGWVRNGGSYSVDYRVIEGDTQIMQGPKSPWEKLRAIIEDEIWVSDDGKRYKIEMTLIDASYRTDEVYMFCQDYERGVYPIQGRDMPPKSAKISNFKEYKSKTGIPAYNVTVTIYKDRLARVLRQDWEDRKQQPFGYPNYPNDYGDDYFRQYEAEVKYEKKTKTGRRLGFFWQKLPNKDNHAWDAHIYNMAALDMIIYDACENELGIDAIHYSSFWQYAIDNPCYT